MKPERVKRLNSIAFPWDPADADNTNNMEPDYEDDGSDTGYETANDVSDENGGDEQSRSGTKSRSMAQSPEHPVGTKVKKVCMKGMLPVQMDSFQDLRITTRWLLLTIFVFSSLKEVDGGMERSLRMTASATKYYMRTEMLKG